MTTKQFTLYAADPSTVLIQFWGVEYPTLHKACQAIRGQVGLKCAMEIHGRAFVLIYDIAQDVAEKGIPFTLGFLDGRRLITLPGNVHGNLTRARWVEDINDPVGWKEITSALESIRDRIGDLMDTIGEIAADSDPHAAEITETDRRVLGKIQYELYHANNIILSARPDVIGKTIESP